MSACLLAAVVVTVSPGSAGAGGDRELTGRGAVVTKPAASRVRTLAPTQGCQVLLDSGDGDCTVVRTVHGDLVVTVEPGPAVDEVLISRPWTVRVWRPSDAMPDGWEVGLSTRPDGPDPGPLYANVTARAADVTGDGRHELILGYRREGTGQILDVDVVGTDRTGAPAVLAHDSVYKGSVRTRRHRLVEYEPVYRREDGNCCPTWIVRKDVRYRDGAFRVHRVWRRPTQQVDVPPSDIG